MQVSIVLPTLNEKENIEIIIPLIASVLEKDDYQYEIIVVDDNSTDGTAEAARAFADRYRIFVHVREHEKGLASAAIYGFSKATGDVLVVMDSDMSHPVDKLHDMISPILQNICDITVGSRHIPGGGCDSWPLIRKIISRGAGSLAFGITKLTDPTSGYMGFKRSLLKNLDLSPVGWKIVLEVVTRSNGKVLEVPIIFKDRIHGKSKLTSLVQIQYLLHLFKLYDFKLPNLWQIVKFCLVGSSGLIIDSIVLASLVELLYFDPRVAVCFSFIAAVAWNYLLDHSWTFRSRRKVSLSLFISFFSVCVVGLLIRVGVMHLLLTKTTIYYLVANFLGVVVSTSLNFVGSKFLVFKK
jgi:dolichol-phosphate mannosyltransferase